MSGNHPEVIQGPESVNLFDHSPKTLAKNEFQLLKKASN